MSALTISAVYPLGVTNLGALDGSCTAVVLGGTTPYQCSHDNVTYFPGTTLNNLPPGNYTFYVKDAANTVVTAPFTIATYPQIINLQVTNETGLSLDNGSVRFTVVGGIPPYYYSIDEIRFTLSTSSSISIFPIAHGSYTLTVIDNQQSPITLKTPFIIQQFLPVRGCTDPAAANYNPNAQINDGSCIYPDPDPDNPFVTNNLYAGPDQFRLVTTNNSVYDIDEPKDYDKINIVLSRDKTYHGVNYEFSDGDIKLRFDDAAGRQLIISDYKKYGNDALMRLQFGFILNSAFVPNFDLQFDFNTYEEQENYVLCGVKRKTFNDMLETRKDSIVNVSDNEITIPLHSKLIREQTIIAMQGKTSDVVTLLKNKYTGPTIQGDPGFLEYATYLDWTQANPNDLFNTGLGFGVYAEVPTDVSEYSFKADGSGPCTMELNFRVMLSAKLLARGFPYTDDGRIGYWSYKWYVVVNNISNSTLLLDVAGNITTAEQNSRYQTAYYEVRQTVNLNLNQGDEVYLYGQFICEDRGFTKDPGFETYLKVFYNQSVITFDSRSTPTNTKALMAFEMMQAVLNGIGANYQNIKLKSNLLGRTAIGYPSNGCAALIAYTNGYQIRGFDNVSRPMQITLADLLSGLNALHCIGVGYELDSNNNYIVRIEQFEYFYQDVEIILFSGVSDYIEDIDTSIIYNELEFGYQKYTNNLPTSQNTLDEFCTDHDYLTPIISFAQKLTQKCKQVASGYAIELTRRLQQANQPNDSWTYDEDIFIISCLEQFPGVYVPEKNENFTVSGVLGPDSVYNVRYSVKRMLDRWHKWVNSGLAYKSLTDILINTYVALNGTPSTPFGLTSQKINPDGCGSTQQFKESSNLYLANYGDFEKAFEPTKITFKKRISWDTFRMLRRCFQGQDTTGKNNGYISVIDCNGVTQKGFLTELSYNPLSELGSFTLRKKFVDLTVPFDCAVYSADNFAQFEAATGLPAEIEQCIFSNFA